MARKAGRDGDEQITSRPYGKVQAVKSKRARFGRERQTLFLEHLAATCNVARSAAAGVTPQCVYKKRVGDALFRAAWEVALEQGYARLEAMLLERAGQTRPIEVSGDAIVDEEPADPELAKFLLREHKRGQTGPAPGHGQGAERRSADWAEVEDYFIAKLKALKVRIGEED